MKQNVSYSNPTKKIRMSFAGCLLALSLSVFTACNDTATTGGAKTADSSSAKQEEVKPGEIPSLKPTAAEPSWGPSITDNMQVVMDKLASYGAPPIESLSPAEARKQPTPTNAVMDVMKENNIPMPPSGVDTMGQEIPVQGGTIHARVYKPKGATGMLPGIVYYHGGGWVIADINTYDASAKAMAEGTGAVVVSVEYRKGPEHKFPTAHNDAFAAYEWVLKNAASVNVDPKMVAVVGESAGGNMACNVSMMARDKGIMIPVRQVLVYPVASSDLNSESYQKYAAAKPLNKPMIEWFVKHYLPNMETAKDPRISLVTANLKGLPPTTIIGAEIDPLASDGKMLSDKLKEAGVDVNYKMYNGVTHEFFGMATVLKEAKDAQALAIADLRKGFGK